MGELPNMLLGVSWILIAARVMTSGLLIWSLVSYLRDLHFYWENGWDFGEDHAG